MSFGLMEPVRTRRFLLYWLPVLIWMVVIFSASSDRMSFQHSSRFIAPLLHWLWPGLSEDVVHATVVAVRKAAHLAEYAVLGLLLWRALRSSLEAEAQRWCWKHAALAVAIVFLYAASDELHQSFVPSREGCFRDVLIDVSGAVAGLGAMWGGGRLLRRW